MKQNLHVLFFPISLTKGMAGSKRIRNFSNCLYHDFNVRISNIIIGNKNQKDADLFPHFNQKQIYYHYKNPFTWLSFPILVLIYLIHLRKKGMKNILYTYSYPNILNIVFIYMARLLRYKVIFDIVEDNFTISDHKSNISKFKNKTSLFLFNNLEKFADGVIGISTHLIEKINKVYRYHNNVVLLPITVVFSTYIEHKKSSDIKIFYGGSFGKKDGLKHLLVAFDNVADKFPHANLILTGRGSLRDEIIFDEIISKTRNKKNVKKLGYVSDQKYKECIESADIHCMTRVNSKFANAGFPFKLGEMLSTGRPVVVTKVGDVARYLDSNTAMLIEPESPCAIEMAITKLILDANYRNEIGANGRKKSLEYFEVTIVTKKLYEFLCNL